MTSAAASKRRCAVSKAEARISTAMWRFPIVTLASSPGARMTQFRPEFAPDVVPPARQHRRRRTGRPGHRVCPRRPDPGSAANALQPARALPGSGPQRAGAGNDKRRRAQPDRWAARPDRLPRIGRGGPFGRSGAADQVLTGEAQGCDPWKGGAEAIDVNDHRVVTGAARRPDERRRDHRRCRGQAAAYGVETDLVVTSV